MKKKNEELNDDVRDHMTHEGRYRDKPRKKNEDAGKPLSASIGDILRSKKNG